MSSDKPFSEAMKLAQAHLAAIRASADRAGAILGKQIIQDEAENRPSADPADTHQQQSEELRRLRIYRADGECTDAK
jgi:hypothetical protein